MKQMCPHGYKICEACRSAEGADARRRLDDEMLLKRFKDHLVNRWIDWAQSRAGTEGYDSPLSYLAAADVKAFLEGK